VLIENLSNQTLDSLSVNDRNRLHNRINDWVVECDDMSVALMRADLSLCASFEEFYDGDDEQDRADDREAWGLN
jgi:hypothetical protein